jgi:menaquinol-cytochrome c reductase iron-sulfur subunit
MKQEADGEDGDRRTFLKLMVGTGSAVFACALAAPAVVFVQAPVHSEGSGSRGLWVKTLRLDALVDGEPRKVSVVADHRDAWTLTKNVELGAVWLIRQGDKVVALSSTCPHLGCAVNLATEGKGFACPCHTSMFDSSGHRTSGPSPRDMDALEARVEAGMVMVDFRRYRMGVAERVEVG